jgi:hypothetical protein
MARLRTIRQKSHRDLKPGEPDGTKKGEQNLRLQVRASGDSVSRLAMGKAGRHAGLYGPQQLDGEHGTSGRHLSLGRRSDLLTSKPPFYSGNLDRQIHERVAPSMTERRKI